MTCIDGHMTIEDDRGNKVEIKAGESVLLPAMAKKYTLEGKGSLICAVSVPKVN